MDNLSCGGMQPLSETKPMNKKPHLTFEMGFCFTLAPFSHPVLKKARRKAHGA